MESLQHMISLLMSLFMTSKRQPSAAETRSATIQSKVTYSMNGAFQKTPKVGSAGISRLFGACTVALVEPSKCPGRCNSEACLTRHTLAQPLNPLRWLSLTYWEFSHRFREAHSCSFLMPGGYNTLSLPVGDRRYHARYEQWWREGYVECKSNFRLRDILRCCDYVPFSCMRIIGAEIVGRGCAHLVNQLTSRSYTSRNLVVVSEFRQVTHQLIALHLKV
jgi:hypothetical protein